MRMRSATRVLPCGTRTDEVRKPCDSAPRAASYVLSWYFSRSGEHRSDMNSPPVPIRPGVWRITTPLGSRPRDVHAYLLELDAGRFVLVDGGANTEEAWTALDAGVREVAGAWERVRTHVVTHMHLDHLGLAARVRAASGARLLMHRLDAERAAHADANSEEEADYRERLLRENGAPEELLRAVNEGRRQSAPLTGFVPADELLDGEGGELPVTPGWEFVWTPGHTAGHISLFRPRDRLLIAGDAVLPRITPTIGVNRQRSDPVGDYLQALDRIERLQPSALLPGHGDPSEAPLQRLQELRAATEEESDRVAGSLREEPLSAWAIVLRRYPGREMPPGVQMLALRETLAHLQHLVRKGRVAATELEGSVTGFARW